MKKITFTLIALVATLCAMAQTKFWVYKNNGTQIECLISEVDSISFTEPSAPIEQVTDACGITYPVVKIGEQYWMAENYRCSRYDTQSEAYNATWLQNNTVPTSSSSGDTPYYTDASDRSNWSSFSSKYGVNLTNAQVKKLGYLYNWAAAVGVEDGKTYGTEPFNGKRQGICPNGWHIPSRAEWQTLYDYIYKDKSLTSNEVGKYLKTTSGWYNGNSDYKPGLDTYGFVALPAGYTSGGSSVTNVGYLTSFWTATPYESGKYFAYIRNLLCNGDILRDFDDQKYRGYSVRCLRD